MTDLALFFTDNGFDIALDGTDLATDSGLRSAVIVSLFTDRRANADDELPSGDGDRRGCWMDMFDDHVKGSRLWLLSREKELPDVLVRAKTYAEEALQWLIDDGIVSAVSVTAEHVRRGVLGLQVRITLPDATEYTDVFNYYLGNS